MSTNEVQRIIDAFNLEPHPEGGYYRETYRGNELIRRLNGDRRSAGTGIYFLLPQEVCTNWHRVNSDELWHFYRGDQLILEIIDNNGRFNREFLNDNPDGEILLQKLVLRNTWQRAYSTGRYSLCGCTVSPGFEFEDFEMIEADDLASKYPAIASDITYNPFS